MKSRTRSLVAVAAAGLLAGLIGVTPAQASDDPPAPAETTVPAEPVIVGTTTTTLPLFGAPLTIGLSTGPGGSLAKVEVNPADGFTAAMVKPNRVAFVNEDGTAKVVVKANNGGERVEVRAGALADVSGPGGWAGDVFGTGTTTEVGFRIAELPDGSPDIVEITTSDPTAVIGAVEYGDGAHHGDHDGDDDERQAKVSIKFTATTPGGTLVRSLSIKAEVETHDGETRAKVRVSLSKIKTLAAPSDTVVGAQAWTGVLCDGTPARIDFVLAADGTIGSSVTVSPEPWKLASDGHSIEVKFPGGEKVRIKVKEHDGKRKVSVDAKIHCGKSEPVVNVPVSEWDKHCKDKGELGGDRHDRCKDDQPAPTTPATEPTTAPTEPTTAPTEPTEPPSSTEGGG